MADLIPPGSAGSVRILPKCLIAWRISFGRGVRIALSRSFCRRFLVLRVWPHEASHGLLLNVDMFTAQLPQWTSIYAPAALRSMFVVKLPAKIDMMLSRFPMASWSLVGVKPFG